ncbi:MAG: acyltransferase [Deltaproteobacteria bacterium]|nr:acyltransferase [Deltaproteobacteria bacterium]
MRRFLGLATCVLSFAYLIFVLNTIQMLSVVFYPFSRKTMREINRWCARSIWGLWVIMAEVQNGIEIRIKGDEIPPRENALLLPNHQTMADVMVLICFAWRCGRVGDLKFFVKEVMKYVPGPGWGMRFLDCIFVKRDWERDKDGILRLFSKYKAESIPVFLVSFLEGTRRTPVKHAAAQAFAEDRGLYVPKHTLVPRTKGFVATMQGLRSHLDAVYVLTIGYPGRIPTLLNCYEAKVERVELHLRRYPIAELPEAEAELSKWVFERFEELDRRLEELAATGAITGPSRDSKVNALDWFRSEKRWTDRERPANH